MSSGGTPGEDRGVPGDAALDTSDGPSARTVCFCFVCASDGPRSPGIDRRVEKEAIGPAIGPPRVLVFFASGSTGFSPDTLQ